MKGTSDYTAKKIDASIAIDGNVKKHLEKCNLEQKVCGYGNWKSWNVQYINSNLME